MLLNMPGEIPFTPPEALEGEPPEKESIETPKPMTRREMIKSGLAAVAGATLTGEIMSHAAKPESDALVPEKGGRDAVEKAKAFENRLYEEIDSVLASRPDKNRNFAVLDEALRRRLEDTIKKLQPVYENLIKKSSTRNFVMDEYGKFFEGAVKAAMATEVMRGVGRKISPKIMEDMEKSRLNRRGFLAFLGGTTAATLGAKSELSKDRSYEQQRAGASRADPGFYANGALMMLSDRMEAEPDSSYQQDRSEERDKQWEDVMEFSSKSEKILKEKFKLESAIEQYAASYFNYEKLHQR